MTLVDIMYVIAALFLLVTAVSRINDIKRDQNGKRWWIRRLGLLMVSVSMVMIIASYVTVPGPYWRNTQRLLGLWGFVFTWLTTPGMPPWWKYISKYDKDHTQ